MARIIILFCFAIAALVASVSACSTGDKACHCKNLGGEWRPAQSILAPACRIHYNHQGRKRWAHVYLPNSYDGSKRFPLWVHLHGVFWNTMSNIGQQVGRPIDGTEIIPVWDHTLRLFGDKAIIVYPQSTGYAGTGNPSDGQGSKYRQFFNVGFWQCSVGVCVDRSVDDVGFIETVMQDMTRRLPVSNGQVLLSGESSGGMLVHVLLCQSSVIPRMVTAAVDILGGLGADYVKSGKCNGGGAAAFLKLHGVKDPFITYDKQILVDGINFLSAIEATRVRASRNGCGSNGEMAGSVVNHPQMQCTDFCAKKAGALPAKLCGMTNVAHDTDFPWPGFVYEQAWSFFTSRARRHRT